MFSDDALLPVDAFITYRPMQNIVGLTMLGVVGSCCLVHANGPNKC